MMGYRQKCSATMYDILYAKGLYCYLQNRHGENVRFEKRRMRRKLRRDLDKELECMVEELNMDELWLIHAMHNRKELCECEDCVEYKRRESDDERDKNEEDNSGAL